MKNLTIGVLVCISLYVSSTFAFAGSGCGKIKRITVAQGSQADPDRVFIIHVNNAPPSCVPQALQHEYALNLHNPYAKAALAALLAAAAQGQTVFIVGNGTCNAWGDREEIGRVEVIYDGSCP